MIRANVNGHECLFAFDERVKLADYPTEYPYKYDIRHDDDNWTLPVTIEPFVLVNFLGSVFTKHPIFSDINPIDIYSFEMEGEWEPFSLSQNSLRKIFEV